jgi:hypothetical protein
MQPKLVGLFDAVVRHIAFPLDKRCFHPKVWVVRQQNDGGDVRWVLVVSSKNLSCDPSWEAGVALTGAPARRTNLPTLSGFVEYVARIGGEERFASLASELDAVEWELPRGVREVRFAWQRGDDRPCAADDGHPLGLPQDVNRVLVVSPFVDRWTIRQLGQRFAAATTASLVAGRLDLDRALFKGMGALGPFKAFVLDVADDPLDIEDPASPDSSNEEDDESRRGLHAKLIATTRTANDATLLVGSLNMTTPAWRGANCEAWLVLEGRAEALFEPLWEWHEVIAPLEYKQPPPDSPPGRSDLDLAHATICASAFRLDEIGSECRLTAEPPVRLDRGAELFVARATVPGSEVRWRPEGIELPPCSASERSRFVVMHVRVAGETKRWLQVIDVVPPIEADRDSSALRDLVAPERLPSLLRSLLDQGSGASDGGGEPGPPGGSNHGAGSSGKSRDDEALTLEDLVSFVERAWRDDSGHGRELVQDAARLVEEYRARAAEEGALRELFEAWDAIREVLT